MKLFRPLLFGFLVFAGCWSLVDMTLANADKKRAGEKPGKQAAKDKDEDGGEKKRKQKQEDLEFDIAGGKFKLVAPDTWIRKEPKVRIIDHEFEVPASEDDERSGRVTVMGAGGTVEENLDRWFGQFLQPDGSSTKDAAEIDEMTVAGQEVHLVDVSGTYVDKPPFAGRGIERENYRMLAAIIATKSGQDYFIKLYGPERTIAENEKAFVGMIEGLEAK